MCRRLSELRVAMGAYAAGFDAALVSVADAERVVQEATAIEHAAAAVKALAAVRLSETEARRERIHRRRQLRNYTDTEGAGHLHLADNPEVIAGIMGVVGPIRDRLARQARAEGRVESLEAHAADALREAVCSGGGKVTHK